MAELLLHLQELQRHEVVVPDDSEQIVNTCVASIFRGEALVQHEDWADNNATPSVQSHRSRTPRSASLRGPPAPPREARGRCGRKPQRSRTAAAAASSCAEEKRGLGGKEAVGATVSAKECM